MNTKIANIARFNLTKDFDNLYNNSKNGDNVYNLMSLIIDERNIRLAYRELKSNSGSKTFDLEGKTINDLMNLSESECIILVRDRLYNYVPKQVKRMYIPKSDGSLRLIGIPSIYDRLIEQCIKQVLEPFCEARFYNHSYAFRPLRDASHALSRVVSLVNRGKCYYAVKLDIDNFFDNVDHKLMIDKLWSFGIRDKKLISIIKSMLTTYSSEGLVQGGILSPILSNIYLTELDRWVESQWEKFPCNGNIHSFHHKKSLSLKHGYIVRYADDIVIMTKEYEYAIRWKYAVSDFLNKRLHLMVNENKSVIVNLRQKHFDYLGFSISAMVKESSKNGYVAKTHISDYSLSKIKSELKQRIVNMQHNTYSDRAAIEYNLTVMGIKNYYKYATMVYLDLDSIARGLSKSIKIRLGDKSKCAKYNDLDTNYKQLNVGVRDYTKIYKVCNTPLHVIQAVHHKNPMNYRQDMSIYSVKGRSFIKDNDEFSLNQLSYVTQQLLDTTSVCFRQSIELADNRITLYLAQKGKSYITGKVVDVVDYHCHHRVAVKCGGSHEYSNLVLVSKDEHKLIHATNIQIIQKYLDILQLSKSELKKVNELRKCLNLSEIY